MKLYLVFENSGDTLIYDVIYNHELLEFFVEQSNKNNNNSFFNKNLSKNIDKFLFDINHAVSKTNEVLIHLIGKKFNKSENLEDYLNQDFLNNQHCDWVFSQKEVINIDNLRFSQISEQKKLGEMLHDFYPDEIREVLLCPIMEKLNYRYWFEEVNMTVHRLESSFKEIEFSSKNKWNAFDNPIKNFYSANDVTNFFLGYTYVGRQYYDKFKNWDDNLKYNDHYNYEMLEYSFHISLDKPETIPYSKEFTQWATEKNVPMITNKIPIANLENISEKISDYRKIIYRNCKNDNAVKLFIK